MDLTGLPRIEQESIARLLESVWLNPLAVSTDYARSRLFYIGMAASAGLISVFDHQGFAHRRWLITERGLQFLDDWHKRNPVSFDTQHQQDY